MSQTLDFRGFKTLTNNVRDSYVRHFYKDRVKNLPVDNTTVNGIVYGADELIAKISKAEDRGTPSSLFQTDINNYVPLLLKARQAVASFQPPPQGGRRYRRNTKRRQSKKRRNTKRRRTSRR
jgi:hypothetical protein